MEKKRIKVNGGDDGEQGNKSEWRRGWRRRGTRVGDGWDKGCEINEPVEDGGEK